jgi:hypothetical protein
MSTAAFQRSVTVTVIESMRNRMRDLLLFADAATMVRKIRFTRTIIHQVHLDTSTTDDPPLCPLVWVVTLFRSFGLLVRTTTIFGRSLLHQYGAVLPATGCLQQVSCELYPPTETQLTLDGSPLTAICEYRQGDNGCSRCGILRLTSSLSTADQGQCIARESPCPDGFTSAGQFCGTFPYVSPPGCPNGCCIQWAERE